MAKDTDGKLKVDKLAAELKKRVKVKMTPVGRGVFARLAFELEAVIGEITGKLLGTDYASDYCMDLDGKALLEPSPPFRFLNHSCEPNCELMLWKTRQVEGEKICRLWLSATREIIAGEELTIDYGWPADSAIKCMCGAESCRGWVVDEQELRKVHRMNARKGVSN